MPSVRRAAGVASLLLALLLLISSGPAAAAAGGTWQLSDGAGHRWGLSLFRQPDPAYPAGWRLRLSARSPGQGVDHERPLRISDGLGGSWELPNRSEELVPPSAASIPGNAGQFDAEVLQPRPSAVLPLRLLLPVSGGGEVALMLPPAAVEALAEASPSP